MPDGVFPWETILTHMPHNKILCKVIFCLGVMTTGGEPCDENNFDNFLRNCGVDVFEVSAFASSKMIVGQEDWDEDKIRSAIKAHEGGSLWVYSQEMVIASMAMGADVFDVCSRDELVSFGEGHPALEYLMEGMGFDWPSTNIITTSNHLTEKGDIEWPTKGVLGQMGYKVGKHGLMQSSRRKILDRALVIELVKETYSPEVDIDEWGKSNSPQRLEKIANCLAAFARNNKRSRTRDNSEAIADYESDLNYLRTTYYRSNLGFHWPDTDVSPY